jgi:hypothetical protein
VSPVPSRLDWRSWSCVLFACLAWTLNTRAAEQNADPIEIDWRIAAQPLDEALQEFSRQGGLQLIYLSSLTKGVQSPGVSGTYTVAAALARLLAGSGLSFRMLNAQTVAIDKVNAGERAQ